eukprot:907426_1
MYHLPLIVPRLRDRLSHLRLPNQPSQEILSHLVVLVQQPKERLSHLPTIRGNTVSPTAAQPTAANTVSPTKRKDCDEDDSLDRADCDDDEPPSGQCSVLITVRFEVCYIEPYKNRRGILWSNVKGLLCLE